MGAHAACGRTRCQFKQYQCSIVCRFLVSLSTVCECVCIRERTRYFVVAVCLFVSADVKNECSSVNTQSLSIRIFIDYIYHHCVSAYINALYMNFWLAERSSEWVSVCTLYNVYILHTYKYQLKMITCVM